MTDHAREAAEKLWPRVTGDTEWPAIREAANKAKADCVEMAIPIIQSAIDAACAEALREAGKRGGKARAKKLSKKRRSDIARQGANARWGNEAIETIDTPEGK